MNRINSTLFQLSSTQLIIIQHAGINVTIAHYNSSISERPKVQYRYSTCLILMKTAINNFVFFLMAFNRVKTGEFSRTIAQEYSHRYTHRGKS